MLEFLKFAFQSPLHWLGITFWMLILAAGIADVVSEIRNNKDKNNDRESEDNN